MAFLLRRVECFWPEGLRKIVHVSIMSDATSHNIAIVHADLDILRPRKVVDVIILTHHVLNFFIS